MISIFHQRPYFKVGANGPPTLLYMSLKWSRGGRGRGSRMEEAWSEDVNLTPIVLEINSSSSQLFAVWDTLRAIGL